MGRLKSPSLGLSLILNERCRSDIFTETSPIAYRLYVALLSACIRETSWFDKSDEMRNRLCFHRNISRGTFYPLSLWIEHSHLLWKRIFFLKWDSILHMNCAEQKQPLFAISFHVQPQIDRNLCRCVCHNHVMTTCNRNVKCI